MEDDAGAQAPEDSPRRVLIKLSGEALGGEGQVGLNVAALASIATELAGAYQVCRQIGIVVGAGNLLRGSDLSRMGMNRIRCDHAGMVATVVNGLALQESLAARRVPATVYSAFAVGTFVEPFSVADATADLDAGRVVIFVGGTGNPLFTTDTAAALRAVEMNARFLMKATKVDGVFSDDPKTHPDAEFFSRLSFDEVLRRRLRVMDLAAFELCRQNRLPIRVFNFQKPGIISRILRGEDEGTLVS